MSFWDNVKKFAQPYADDDYDDYDEEDDYADDYEEPAAPPSPRLLWFYTFALPSQVLWVFSVSPACPFSHHTDKILLRIPCLCSFIT